MNAKLLMKAEIALYFLMGVAVAAGILVANGAMREQRELQKRTQYLFIDRLKLLSHEATIDLMRAAIGLRAAGVEVVAVGGPTGLKADAPGRGVAEGRWRFRVVPPGEAAALALERTMLDELRSRLASLRPGLTVGALTLDRATGMVSVRYEAPVPPIP